jgi:3-hydroxyacyl-[acyl-carrier-protein] dehydratase
MRFDQNEIISVIPHRPPFLFIDAIEDVVFGEWGVGVKTLSEKDDFIRTYRPGGMILPRTLIIEAMAQTAAFVMAGKRSAPDRDGSDAPTLGYLVRVKNVVFFDDAAAGDTLRFEVRLAATLKNIYQFDVTTVRDGERISEGSLTFSVFRGGDTPK